MRRCWQAAARARPRPRPAPMGTLRPTQAAPAQCTPARLSARAPQNRRSRAGSTATRPLAARSLLQLASNRGGTRTARRAAWRAVAARPSLTAACSLRRWQRRPCAMEPLAQAGRARARPREIAAAGGRPRRSQRSAGPRAPDLGNVAEAGRRGARQRRTARGHARTPRRCCSGGSSSLRPCTPPGSRARRCGR